MILTAHQPVYLPWLGLFHKIALADMFVSFNQVQYQVKDWNNRNRVKTPQGAAWLSVPVRKKGFLEKKIADIEIDNSAPWRRKHWLTLQHNYKKAPHFHRYADFFEEVYSREWKTLVELNEYMLAWFLETLGIKTLFQSAADCGFQGEKSDLILDMCRTLDADIYIFGTQGRDYADRESFASADVAIYFQNYNHPVYPQLHDSFVSHLSIVDLLFNCGGASLDILMSANINREMLQREACA